MLGFGHQYALLVTVPINFAQFQAPIRFIGYRTDGLGTVSGTNTLYWLPYRWTWHSSRHQYALLVTVAEDFARFRAPIPFIGYRTDEFCTVPGTNTLYWLPYRWTWHSFGHQYALLITVAEDFARFRAPIPFIDYRSDRFCSVSGTNTLYWLPYQGTWHSFGRQYAFLVTVPMDFAQFRTPIPLIGYRTDGFCTVSGINTLNWLPNW